MELNSIVDTKKISTQYILSFINQWKNKGLLPKNVVAKKGIPLEKATNASRTYTDERYRRPTG